jgi:hypothetical protein
MRYLHGRQSIYRYGGQVRRELHRKGPRGRSEEIALTDGLSTLVRRTVGASHLARNIGEDHLMTRRLVLAARVSSIVLLGGTALASIALSFWSTFEERSGEAALRKLGASISDAKYGGRSVELPTQISDDTLTKEGPHLEKLNIARLSIPHAKFTSLEPLKGLTNLSSLDLSVTPQASRAWSR